MTTSSPISLPPSRPMHGSRGRAAERASGVVELERGARQAWLCPHCQQSSRDIRHVCGHCLHMEPGVLPPAHVGGTGNDGTQKLYVSNTGEAAVSLTDPHASVTLSHQDTLDRHVTLFRTPHTGRVYRRYVEPISAPVRRRIAQEANTADLRASQQPANDENGDEEYTHERETESSDAGVNEWEEACVDPPNADRCSVHEAEECKGGAASAVRRVTIHDVVREAAHRGEAEHSRHAKPSHHRPASSSSTLSSPSDSPYTHFVSLPIGKFTSVSAAAESLRSRMDRWITQQQQPAHSAAAVGESTKDYYPSASVAGQQPLTRVHLIPHTAQMHVTLLLLTLRNKEEVELAKTLLHTTFRTLWAAAQAAWRRTNSAAQRGEWSMARLSRLCAMETTPRDTGERGAARVVYMDAADACTREVLDGLVEAVQTALRELISDLAEAERTRRRPHMTLVNAKWAAHASASTSSGRNYTNSRKSIDVRPLLKAFGEASLGAGQDGTEPFALEWIELCRRGPKDRQTHGYVVETKVSLSSDVSTTDAGAAKGTQVGSRQPCFIIMMYNYIPLTPSHRSSAAPASRLATHPASQDTSLRAHVSPSPSHRLRDTSATPHSVSSKCTPSSSSSSSSRSSSASSLSYSSSSLSSSSALSSSCSPAHSAAASSSTSVLSLSSSPRAAAAAHRDRRARCRIGDLFDLPAPLIICLVRHVDGGGREAVSTPASVEQCVRELQAYFDSSVSAESIVCAPQTSLPSVSAGRTKVSTRAHINSSNNSNKRTMNTNYSAPNTNEDHRVESDRRVHDTSHEGHTHSDRAGDVICNEGDGCVDAGKDDDVGGGLSMCCLPGSRVRFQFGKTVYPSLSTREAILSIYIYSIDEPESQPRALESVVVAWLAELKRAGMEQDALVMLLMQSRTTKGEEASSDTGGHPNASSHTESTNNNDSTNHNNLNSNNNASNSGDSRGHTVSNESSRLAPYFAVLRDHGFGARQMCAYRVGEAGVWVLSALRTAFAARLRTRQKAWRTHDASLAAPHAHAEEGVRSRSRRQPPTQSQLQPTSTKSNLNPNTRRARETSSTTGSSTPAHPPRHPNTSVALSFPSSFASASSSFALESRGAMRWCWRALWLRGVALATLYLQFGLVRAARAVFEQLFLDFFNHSDSYPFVPLHAARRQWQQLCRHQRHARACHRLRLVSSSSSSSSSSPSSQIAAQVNKEEEGPVVILTSRHPSHASASSRAQRLLDTAAAALSCSLLLADYPHARRRWDLLLQLVYEAMEDADEVQRSASRSVCDTRQATLPRVTHPPVSQHTQERIKKSNTNSSNNHTNNVYKSNDDDERALYVWRQGLFLQLCLTAVRLFFVPPRSPSSSSSSSSSPTTTSSPIHSLAAEAGLLSSTSVFASDTPMSTVSLTGSARRWWCAAVTDWLQRGRVCLEKMVTGAGITMIRQTAADSNQLRQQQQQPVNCPHVRHVLTPRRVYRMLQHCATSAQTGSCSVANADVCVMWHTLTTLMADTAREAGFVRLAQVQSILSQLVYPVTTLKRDSSVERQRSPEEEGVHAERESEKVEDAHVSSKRSRLVSVLDCSSSSGSSTRGNKGTHRDAVDVNGVSAAFASLDLTRCMGSDNVAHDDWLRPLTTQMRVAPALVSETPYTTPMLTNGLQKDGHRAAHRCDDDAAKAEAEACWQSWQQWRRAVVSLIRGSTLPKRSILAQEKAQRVECGNKACANSDDPSGDLHHTNDTMGPIVQHEANHAWASSLCFLPGLQQLRCVMAGETATGLWARLCASDSRMASLESKKPPPLSLRAFWRDMCLRAQQPPSSSTNKEVVFVLRARHVVDLIDACTSYDTKVSSGGANSKNNSNNTDVLSRDNNRNSSSDNNVLMEMTLQSCTRSHRQRRLVGHSWHGMRSPHTIRGTTHVYWRWSNDNVGIDTRVESSPHVQQQLLQEEEDEEEEDENDVFCVSWIRVRRGNTTLMWRRRSRTRAEPVSLLGRGAHREATHTPADSAGRTVWTSVSAWRGALSRPLRTSLEAGKNNNTASDDHDDDGLWTCALAMPPAEEHYFVHDEADYRIRLERSTREHHHEAKGAAGEVNEDVYTTRVECVSDVQVLECASGHCDSSLDTSEYDYAMDSDTAEEEEEPETNRATKTNNLDDDDDDHNNYHYYHYYSTHKDDTPCVVNESLPASHAHADVPEEHAHRNQAHFAVAHGVHDTRHANDGSSSSIMQDADTPVHWADVNVTHGAVVRVRVRARVSAASARTPHVTLPASLLNSLSCTQQSTWSVSHLWDGYETGHACDARTQDENSRSCDSNSSIVESVYAIKQNSAQTMTSAYMLCEYAGQVADNNSSAPLRVCLVRASSNAPTKGFGEAYSVFPVPLTVADVVTRNSGGCLWRVSRLTVQTRRGELWLQQQHEEKEVAIKRRNNSVYDGSSSQTEGLHQEEHEPARTLPLLPVYLVSSSLCRAESRRKDVCDTAADVTLSHVAQATNRLRIRARLPALLSVSDRLGHALSVDYRFHEHHGRVYCVVVMRNNLTQTTLHVPHAQLIVSRVCANSHTATCTRTHENTSRINIVDDTHDTNYCNNNSSNVTEKQDGSGDDQNAGYVVSRVTSVCASVCRSPWPPRAVCQLCFELTQQPGVRMRAGEAAAVQLQAYYRRWSRTRNESAAQDAVRPDHTDEKGTSLSHIMSTCNVFYGALMPAPRCAAVLFRVSVELLTVTDDSATHSTSSDQTTPFASVSSMRRYAQNTRDNAQESHNSAKPLRPPHADDVVVVVGKDEGVTFRVRIETSAARSLWPSKARNEELFVVDLVAHPNEWVIADGQARVCRTIGADSPVMTIFFTANVNATAASSSSSASLSSAATRASHEGGVVRWHRVPTVRMYWADPSHGAERKDTERLGRHRRAMSSSGGGMGVNSAESEQSADADSHAQTWNENYHARSGRGGSMRSELDEPSEVCEAGAEVPIEVIRFPEFVRVHRP